MRGGDVLMTVSTAIVPSAGDTATTVPDLDFPTYHGINVGRIGEDGDMVALGHHDPRHVLSSFNALAKSLGLVDLLDGGEHDAARWRAALRRLRHTWAVTIQTCGECDDDPECCACSEIREALSTGGWALYYDSDASEPGAFPVTVLRGTRS